MNIDKNLKAGTLSTLIFFGLSACGGGSTDSGGADINRGLLRCVSVVDTTVTNNCTFNANIRYFSGQITPSSAPETITLLIPGQVFSVAPFDSQRQSGIPACQAPLAPSQIFQATTTIRCE